MGENIGFKLPLEGWVSIGYVLIGLLFILWISALLRMGQLRKRLNGFIKDTGLSDLESVMKRLHQQTEAVANTVESSIRRLDALERKAALMRTNVGMLRYNAFGDRGSDLSFSVAFVNDQKDGIVISALQSRDESRVYAKPLEAGLSSYQLTPEEKKAIIQASQKL